MDFSCPHCGQALEIPDSHRGALVRCPICRGEYRARDHLRERPSASGSMSSSTPAAPSRPSPSPPPPVVAAEPFEPFGGSKKSKWGGGFGWFRLAKIVGFIVLVVFVKGGHLIFRERPANPPPRPVPLPVQPFPNPAWPPQPVGQPIPPPNPPIPPFPNLPAEANENPPREVGAEEAPVAGPQPPRSDQ